MKQASVLTLPVKQLRQLLYSGIIGLRDICYRQITWYLRRITLFSLRFPGQHLLILLNN